MLEVLQYLALISAFLLPWMTGALVKAAKAGERKKIVVISLVLAVILVIIGVSVYIAFALHRD